MTTVTTPSPTPLTPVARVRIAPPGLGHELRGAKVVWHRELIRFSQDRVRILTALVQPVLYVFVLGTGLSSLTSGATGDVSLQTFMFPGVLALSVLFTAMFSAVSIVWDREFGFLREMLVAPVRRSSLIFGKALGGATVATFQGLIVLALAPLVDVPYNPVMILALIGEMMILGFSLTAFGLVIAARVRQMQAMMGLMQMVMLPMMFLSGALYPLNDLPGWLNFLVKINPITYAVHPMRTTVFNHVDADPASLAKLNPPLTWFGWTVPTLVQLAVVLVSGLILLGIAVLEFNHAD
jgi:ABC-2 type transport system permease protein